MPTKEEIRDRVQQRTYMEVVEKLEQYGICNLVRPVGFGKTYLLARLAEDREYSAVVYFYPNVTVRMQSIGECCSKEIYYVTYQMLARQYNSIESGEFIRKVTGRNIDKGILFIFDESHFIGGDKTSEAFLRLYNTYREGNYFVGSTATSIRNNKLDVTTEYFKGIQPFYYDTNSGMADGLYYPVKCVYCNFNVSSVAVHELNKNKDFNSLSEDKKAKYQKFILNKTMKVSRINNASEVYRNSIMDTIPEEHRRYMRFIVFVSSYDIMNFQKLYLYEDFRQAFPDKEIRIVEVKTLEDVENLADLGEEDGRIDLIMSVDLLQHGYHDEKLSGVIMLRSTTSEKVFSQSTLRGLSVINDHSTLVLDMLGSHSKIENLKFSTFEEPSYRFHNSGGKGYLDKKYIKVQSISTKMNTVYDLTQIDRLKRALKVDVLVKKGVMPLDVACKELALKEEVLYDGLIELAEEASKYFK